MSHKPEGPSALSPYAALSTSQGTPPREQTQDAGTLASLLHDTAPRCLVDEALKLEALKAALWAAFKAAPETAIPAPLIELATVYTNALRLQMNLIGYSPARPRPAADHGTVTARGRSDRLQSTLLAPSKSNVNT